MPNKSAIPKSYNAEFLLAIFGGIFYFYKVKLNNSLSLLSLDPLVCLSIMLILILLTSIGVYLYKTRFKVHALFGSQKPITKSNKLIQRESLLSLTNRHTLILGTPGTGKTFGVLYPQIYEDIKANKFIVIIDPKGDHSFRDAVYSMAKLFNRSDSFHYISLNHPKMSTPYTFLNFGTPTELRDKLIAATTWDNSYYKKLAETKLLSILEENPKTLIEIVKKIPDTESFAGLRADIFNLHQSPLHDSFIDIDAQTLLNFYHQRSILFISLDVLSFPLTSRSLGRIILNDIKTLVNHIQSQIVENDRIATTLIIDEFVSFATLEFIDLLNKARSARIQVLMATQSVSDFDVNDKNLLPQIIDSTTNKIILRLSDPKSIEYCSKLTGTTNDTKITNQVETNLFFNTSTGVGSEREVERFIIAPKDIRQLGTLEGFLYTQDPFYVSKVYFNRFKNFPLTITPYTHKTSFSASLTNDIQLIKGELPPCSL